MWLTLPHKYQAYRPPEPLRLKEMMKFNQTSNELRLIDDLVEDFWQLHLQVKSHLQVKNDSSLSLVEITVKSKGTNSMVYLYWHGISGRGNVTFNIWPQKYSVKLILPCVLIFSYSVDQSHQDVQYPDFYCNGTKRSKFLLTKINITAFLIWNEFKFAIDLYDSQKIYP